MRPPCLLATILLAATALVGAPSTAAATALVLAPSMAAAAEIPDWQPCPANAAVQCASLTVPIDWSQPNGPAFRLAVARRPASDPAHRAGTLIYAPAGPGSSGVATLTTDAEFTLLFPAKIAADFDIVSFDPRGVGGSDPVRCDASVVDRLNGPTPANQAQFTALLAAQAAVGANCATRTGPIFDHLDSDSQARDLDTLRAALGEATINLYALSYGTVLGEMYAELFPHHIRAMVLDGNVDHSVSADRFALAGAVAAQQTFDQFVDWCDANTSCELHGRDIRSMVATLFAEVDNGTLPDPGNPGRHLDETGLNQLIVEPNLAIPNLPAEAHEIATLSAPATPTGNTAPDSGTVGTVALPIYLQCADFANTTTSYDRLAALLARSRAVAPDVRMGASSIAMLCVNPPFPVANPQHRLDVRGAPPILVLNSRYDTQTPYQGAQRVAAQIDGAELVTYDGIGHGAATRGTCTEDIEYRYLAQDELPPPGTHCPAAPSN